MKVSSRLPRRPLPSAGFTLAEVMVALVLVGGLLVYTLVGLNLSTLDAGHTFQIKQARQLALYTLGQIESGLFWEEMDDEIRGTYAEQGYPDFSYEVVFGEDDFRSDEDSFDSFALDEDEDEEDEDEVERAYEQVRVKVMFPKIGDFSNELVLERWVAWEQVYPDDGSEDEEPGQELPR